MKSLASIRKRSSRMRISILAVFGLVLVAVLPAPAAHSQGDAWEQQAILNPENLATGQNSVAIAGDTIVVLTASVDMRGAEVFIRQAGDWVQAASLGMPLVGYGIAVAISQDASTIVVGLSGSTPDESAVCVFSRPEGGWADMAAPTAVLTVPTDCDMCDLGRDVAIDGDTIVASAPDAAVGADEYHGALFVFVKPEGTGWADAGPNARLDASDAVRNTRLGTSVAIEGGTIAAYGGGSVYLFERPDSGWADSTESAKLHPADVALYNQVALSEGILAAGATLPSGQRGAALFAKDAGTWTQVASAYPSENTGSVETFGQSLALSGDTLVAGDIFENDQAGAVFVFTRPQTGWAGDLTESAKLVNAEDSSYMGTAIAIDGDTFVTLSDGGAHVYTRVPPCAGAIAVTHTGDSGPGSLRQAIADVCPGGTITFDGDFTIALASELAVDKSMTIDGAGHSVTISGDSDGDGSGDVRVLHVVAEGLSISLQNLNVIQGSAEYGGGLGSEYPVMLDIAHVTFDGNQATGGISSLGGGAIAVWGGGVTLTDVSLSNNTSTGIGGAMSYLSDLGVGVTATDVTFRDNSAFSIGGALAAIGPIDIIRDTDVTLTRVTFIGNSTDLDNDEGGGGGLATDSQDVVLTDVAFIGNSGYHAGGMAHSYGNATLTNVTLGGNSALMNGGALYVYNQEGYVVTVQNSIVWGNTAVDGPEMSVEDPYGGEMIVVYSDIAGGWAGEGNIDADPLFVDMANGDLRLQPGSPAANAGDQTLRPLDLTVDLDGNPRVVGGQLDMGAYELQPGANTPPVADPGAPYLGAVNTDIQLDGSGSYDPEGDALSYTWDFGDGTTGTGAAPLHSYAVPSIYDVCLTVNDGALDSDPACTIAVVYDPEGGFVTGGGWIVSPAGAYKPDETLSGKATFGFVSKYKKGASVPTGNTEFQFHAVGFNFHSTSYDWLVVNQAGTNAQFKGSGMVNGGPAPDGSAYRFMLWAGDGAPDTFRIKIWWEDTAGEHAVYDNGVDQPIGGGNIVVHKK